MGYEKAKAEHILASDRTGGSNGVILVTTSASDTKAQNVPLLYDANGNVVSTTTRSGNTTKFASVASGTLTAGVPLIWDGSGNIDEATRTGNTTIYASHDAGSKTAGNAVSYDASGNLTDSGVTPGGGGASLSWTLAAEWHHSVDGNTSLPIDFTGLGTVSGILAIARLVVLSSSSNRGFYASVNNGTSFFQGGTDYVRLNGNGTETSVSAWSTHSTAASTGKTIFVHCPNADSAAANKVNLIDVLQFPNMFVASTSAVNAIRFDTPIANTATGGDIWIYTR